MKAEAPDRAVFEGVIIPGGAESTDSLAAYGHAVHFAAEANRHRKPVAASAEETRLHRRAGIDETQHLRDSGAPDEVAARNGVVTATDGGALPELFHS